SSGKPASHLYRESGSPRVVVDRQVEAYRLYARKCLIYEAPRPQGRFLFVVWGGLTPVAFRTSVGPSRWRLDTDGPRRFETLLDPDGRRETAVMYAARYRNLEMAKLLLEAGARSTIRDDIGRTAAVWVPDGSTDDLRELRALLDRAVAGGK